MQFSYYTTYILHLASFILKFWIDFSAAKIMLWRNSLSVITFVCYVQSSESIRWPAGTYGLPKPASGCPLADGFQWKQGWRSQDTEDHFSNNTKSPNFHLDGIVDSEKVMRSFCIKTVTADDKDRPDWPPGQYCVYQKGQCPKGLKSGYVFWDDEDLSNRNDKDGTLPIGEYYWNTKIYFCCKTDGDKNDPILLPSKSPFFLLAYNSEKCQMVKWTIATVEWIHYNTEYLSNDDHGVGAYPYQAGGKHPTIFYCYYRGCNKTLTAVNGTFQSPNYPNEYPDGQYCSWRIMVNTSQQIHLMFTAFSLQNENNTDALYVYDGEDSRRKLLEVYYGSYPPPKEGIFSSSNRMLVIFKSDKTGSYTGFSASYYGVNISAPVTTTQAPEVTFSPAVTVPATFHTMEETTSSRDPNSTTNGPTKESGNRDERKQPRRKDFNLVAVVVPVVLVVFLVAGLIAALFYCRRKRTGNSSKPNEVIFSARSSDESPISLENPYYDRGLDIAGEPSYSEGNEMYTDVEEPGKLSKEKPYRDQKNENPLYEGADANEATFNPIYGSELVMANTQGSSFCEGNELYTDVEEADENNEKKLYTEQESDNPLYEVAGTDDAVFNPIYDSSI